MTGFPQSGQSRIFVISDQPIFREALRLLLDAQTDFRVVGTAPDCERAVEPALDSRAEILLLDVGTHGVPGHHVFHILSNACPSARLILLMPDAEESQIIDLLRCGVHGVVVKGVRTEVLFQSIRAVASGQYWAGRETMSRLMQTLLAGDTPAPRRFGLTARELQIVAVLVDGCANKEIAEQCGISEKTVKHHLTNIFDKIGVSNRLQLMIFALHHQLVPLLPPNTFV